MLKLLKWVLIGIVALAVLLLGGGLLLKSEFSVTRQVDINAPADKLYGLVADPREWKRWSVWNQRDPAMQITFSGPASGTGAGWAWKSQTEGDGRMSFTAAEPGQRVAYDLFLPDFGTTSHGDLSFKPNANGGTTVIWRMEGDMGSHPIYHWFALFSDRMIGPDFEAGLARLKALAEQP